MARKRFKTVTQPFGTELLHTSEAKAYEVVNGCREIWQAGTAGEATPTGVTVYEYDATLAWSGREPWQLFDTYDFAKGE